MTSDEDPMHGEAQPLRQRATLTNAAPRRWRVGLACSEAVRRRYVDAADLVRIEAAAHFSYSAFGDPDEVDGQTPRNAAAEAELGQFASSLDVLIVCRGAPFVSDNVLADAPRLSMLGELEGDRFGDRLDVEAASRRGIRVVDVTHGSSWPTAEWALGLALIGRRNAGALFRRMIAHEPSVPHIDRSGLGFEQAELSDKRIGLIGFGHLAWRLIELLRPFHVDAVAFDPYAPRELAEAYNVSFGPLERALDSDVVFVLLPLTAATEGMIGAAELELLRPGSVFVNVSRGKVVDSAALLARVSRGDVIACLDVFDPEPIPLDSPVRDLPNVFLTPHIGGYTEESRRRFFSLMVDECLRHFAGVEPRASLTTGQVRRRPAHEPR
jgi:phosphoglycerate dehydrogenase-like enzyme